MPRLLIILLLLSHAAVADEHETDVTEELTKEQMVRLPCVEVIHSANAHTGPSTFSTGADKEAARQIKKMTQWCARFVLNGEED